MTSTLLILQFILTVILTITVLLQKSSSIGLGAYSGSNESVFGAKGPGSFLTNFTFFLGALFIINTVSLGYLYNQDNKNSVAETITVTDAPKGAIVPTVPSAPNADKKVVIDTSKIKVAPTAPVKEEETTTPKAPVADTK